MTASPRLKKSTEGKLNYYVNLIKNIIISIGLPGLIIYIIYLNSSKSEFKNAEIELLHSQIEVLKTSQIDELIKKNKSLKEYYESELNSIKDDFQNVAHIKDSLQNVLKSPILLVDGRYFFTGDQVKAIYKDYVTLKYDSMIIQVQNEMLGNQKYIIDNQDSKLINLNKITDIQKQQLQNLEELIANREKVISIQERQIKRLEKQQKK